jgi:CheY-like chemotaxis protein
VKVLCLILDEGVKPMNASARRPVVLIVEDEFLLRMDAAHTIEEAGFEVLEAGSADEAIEILEARLDITVVFTDIRMPGSMDGLRLAALIRGRWPPLKIVATSGLVDVREDDLPEGGRFLPKPYRPEQIVATLRELIACRLQRSTVRHLYNDCVARVTIFDATISEVHLVRYR